MKKFLIYILAIFLLVIILFYSLLCTNVFFKHITVSFINSLSSVNLQVNEWDFKPWKSVQAKGLLLADISKNTGITNFYLHADKLLLKYKASSFFSGRPEFTLVEVEGIDIITAETKQKKRRKAKKGKARSSSKKHTHKKGKHKNPFLSTLPFDIKKLVLKNCNFKLLDNNNISLGVHNFNLAALNLVTNCNGSALANGSFYYYDGSNVFLDSLPFACEFNYMIDETIIPNIFSSVILASNVVGKSGKVDFAPLTVELNVNSAKSENNLHLKKFLLNGYWNGKQFSTLSITGNFNFIKNLLNLSPVIKIASNEFYQAVIASHQKLDIRQTDAIGLFNFNADLRSKKYNLNGRFVLNKIKAKKNKTLPAMNFVGAFDLSFNNKSQQLDIKKINFIVKDKSHPMVQLKTDSPVVLKLGSNFKNAVSTSETAKIELIANNIKFNYFNDFVQNKNVRFNAGNFSGKINCNIIGSGHEIIIASKIVTKNIDFSMKKSRWSNIDVNINVDSKIDKLQNVTLSALSIKFISNQNNIGEIAAGGIFDLKSGKHRIAVAASDVSGVLFRPLFDTKKKNKNYKDLLFNSKLLFTRHENDDTKNLSAYFSLTDSNRLSVDELEKITLDLNVNLTPQKLVFNKCELLSLPGKWDDNKLKLTGEVYLDKSGKLSELTLQSKHFDATALLDEFMPKEPAQPKAKKEKSNKKPPVKKKEKKKTKEPSPINIKDLNLVFSAHIDEFIARAMVIKPLSFDFTLKNSKARFLTRNVTINEGTFDLDSQMDMNVTGFLYSSHIECAAIPLKPVFDTWVPKASDLIVGDLSGKIKFKGKGFSVKNLNNFFVGKAQININNGHLGEVPFLKAMAKMLKVKELADYSFNQCSLEGYSLGGTNFIKKVNVKGKTLEMGITGFTTFEKDLDLDVYLALSGKVIANIFAKQDKFKIPFTGALDKFYKLPMPIKVGGTINKPDVQSNVKEFIPMLIKIIGNDALNVIDKIFGNDKKKSENLEETGLKILEGLLDKKTKEKPQQQKSKQYNLPHRIK